MRLKGGRLPNEKGSLEGPATRVIKVIRWTLDFAGLLLKLKILIHTP